MQYKCAICGYIYDEEVEGTLFKDLGEDFVCPMCGAPKSLFEEVNVKVESKPEVSLEEEDLEEFSNLELAAIFSNLARGSEKQYKPEWEEAYKKLASYFTNRAKVEDGNLLSLIKEDLDLYYPSLIKEAITKGDRGLLRALTWGQKVTNMEKTLLERYEKEGLGFLEGKKVYVCTICGFIYIGIDLPAVCPVCKVPSFKFAEVK